MLTDAQARKAAPRDKPYKLSDSGGLYLYVAPTGLRSWRMKFRFQNKEKLLTFGPYPEVPLSEARQRRDDARRQLRDNEDPSGARAKSKATKDAERLERARKLSFEQLARTWHGLQSPRWAPVHADDVITSLSRDVFPDLGDRALDEIDAPAVLATLRKVEARGSIETARRLRQRISAVFAYAISEGFASNDPAAIVTKALKPLPKKGKQPALVDIESLRSVLIAAEASGASPVTKMASRLLALTAVRPAVVRGVSWDEFEGIDWGGDAIGPGMPVWRVPAARMKLVLDRKDEESFEHIVPLSWQAVDVLREVRRLTGRGSLVFPGQRHAHRPLSENAIGYLYNRVGYHGRHVPHGWRAAFSTIMNERHRPDRAIIDLMLAHVPGNKVEAAYNRAQHMTRRRELAQEWANLLMEGMANAGALLDGPRR
ncbi:integrase arm-type DNA-binding domain-containing protein [Sphingobium sp. 3R8]|uniref:tyrosine-type recombinase/integrase n=1 Tax=Sphingobium sp. 3R8 TaxID=2874921 RepID=UPI001CCCECAD|nr:integrase arm-type DNA-binding domain-containing protein [Sphingobium sp. 3R8]MBZ9649972.1 integrase arm-type DNA-binding domain-containing protein [Sphingobium sp. 3R8]